MRTSLIYSSRRYGVDFCDVIVCPGRPDRSPADPAGEDVTEFDSIPAGRIDQEGPYCITDFRAVPFRRRRACPGLCPSAVSPSAVSFRGVPFRGPTLGCGSQPHHAFPESLQYTKSTTDSTSSNFYRGGFGLLGGFGGL